MGETREAASRCAHQKYGAGQANEAYSAEDRKAKDAASDYFRKVDPEMAAELAQQSASIDELL